MNPTKTEKLLFRVIVGLATAALATLVVLALNGCTTTKTVPGPTVYQRVEVPVPAPCLRADQIPPHDGAAPDALRGMDTVTRQKNVNGDWFGQRAENDTLRALIAACIGAPPNP